MQEPSLFPIPEPQPQSASQAMQPAHQPAPQLTPSTAPQSAQPTTPAPVDELVCRIAFSRIKGMTVSLAQQLLEATGGSCTRLFTAPMQELSVINGLENHGFTESVRRELLLHAGKEAEFVRRHHLKCLFFTDADYPRRLLDCEDAPVLLYTLGECNLNAKHSVGIVGTRSATVYGVNFINKLVDELRDRLDDVLIVSGLAMGCDIAGHRRAMADGIPTAAVLAHGLDTIYPMDNRNDAMRIAGGAGALVTDYPSGVWPFRGNFLARNRIVAGMVDALVVVESAESHGGALHTARIAYEYGREVFALPGRTSDTYSGGCNKLIRRHVATLCRGTDDIIDVLGWTAKPQEGEQQKLFKVLSPAEQSIADCLQRKGDVSADVISRDTGLPIGQLLGMLMELEAEGVLLALPGNRYRLA